MVAFYPKKNYTQMVVAIEGFDLPVALSYSSAEKQVETRKGAKTHILDLPHELLVVISMHTGFRNCMLLSRVCSLWRTLVRDPSSWYDYSLSPDTVEVRATVHTKFFRLDRMEFGLWNNEWYIEHMTFDPEYDHLGGVTFRMNRSGQVKTSFFEHVTSLPCYLAEIQHDVATGALPPPLDPSSNEVRRSHSCPECINYESQQIFVSQPMATKENMILTHTFDDGKRILVIEVLDLISLPGFNQDVPWVHSELYALNGVKLTMRERDQFRKLVQK